MESQQPSFFSGPYIDRRAEEREYPDWARRALADRQTLYLLGSGTRHLVYTQPEPRIAFLDAAVATALATADESRLVLLGWFRERRCVLLEVAPEASLQLPPHASFEELRPLSPLLAGEEAALLAYARYDSSQPWPFPASIMIGFRAWARPGSPARGSGELEDARWFTREEILAGAALLPPVHSISRRLIGAWMDGK